MTYASEVLADSPQLYWKLDETGFLDSGSNGQQFVSGGGVTAHLSPLLADGGYAVAGSGSAPIATLSSMPAAITDGNVTLEAWVNIPAGNVSGSFVKIGSTANGWGMGIGGTQWVNTGRKLIMLSEQVAWLPTTYTFTTGIHHVVAVRGAAGAVTAYVDGVNVWSGTLSSPRTATGIIGVGGIPGAAYAPIMSSITVDNVAIFPAALSATQVSAHYNSGTGSNTALAADSPTVWLKLDETPTVGVLDSSSNNRSGSTHNGVAVGQTSLLGDHTGTAAYYSGTAWTSLASAAWMDQANFTAECRIIAPASTGDQFIASRWGGSGARIWLLKVSSGKLAGQVNVGGNESLIATGATSLTPGTAYTVALKYDGAAISVYVNGVLDGTLSTAGTVATSSTAPIELGRAALSVYGTLTIDEFSFTGSALSDARIATRHTAAISSPPSGTLAATLPSLAATLSGTYGPSGSVSANLPSLTADIESAFQLPGTSGDLTATLPTLAGNLAGSYALAGSLAATLPAMVANMVGVAEAGGSLTATLPSLTAELTGTNGNDFLVAVLPSLSADIEGHATPIVQVGTNRANRGNGIRLSGSAATEAAAPLADDPPNLTTAPIRIITPTVPAPTLVNGRPQ